MIDDVRGDNTSPVDDIEGGVPLDAVRAWKGGADPKAIVPQKQPPLRLPDTPSPPPSPPEDKK